MDYGFFQAFEQLCDSVNQIQVDIAEIKDWITQQKLDADAINAATQRLKESGDALDEKVKANPAPAP